MKFVVTFPIGGALADAFCEVEAVDELAARQAIIGVYGRDGWAGVYRAGPDAEAMVAGYALVRVEFGTGSGGASSPPDAFGRRVTTQEEP